MYNSTSEFMYDIPSIEHRRDKIEENYTFRKDARLFLEIKHIHFFQTKNNPALCVHLLEVLGLFKNINPKSPCMYELENAHGLKYLHRFT